MLIRKLRLSKGWSQEHLAEVSGLSVRTVQRAEGGRKVGLETMKCLAAVFETDVSSLTQEQTMTDTISPDLNTASAVNTGNEMADHKKAFWMNVATFLVLMPCLYLLNAYLMPEFFWAHIILLFWGGSSVLHGLIMLGMHMSRSRKDQ